MIYSEPFLFWGVAQKGFAGVLTKKCLGSAHIRWVRYCASKRHCRYKVKYYQIKETKSVWCYNGKPLQSKCQGGKAPCSSLVLSDIYMYTYTHLKTMDGNFIARRSFWDQSYSNRTCAKLKGIRMLLQYIGCLLIYFRPIRSKWVNIVKQISYKLNSCHGICAKFLM